MLEMMWDEILTLEFPASHTFLIKNQQFTLITLTGSWEPSEMDMVQ